MEHFYCNLAIFQFSDYKSWLILSISKWGRHLNRTLNQGYLYNDKFIIMNVIFLIIASGPLSIYITVSSLLLSLILLSLFLLKLYLKRRKLISAFPLIYISKLLKLLIVIRQISCDRIIILVYFFLYNLSLRVKVIDRESNASYFIKYFS